MEEAQKYIDIRKKLDEIDERFRASVVNLFESEAHGTPDRISKAGCMALAKMGAGAWNAWRDKFPPEPYGHFDYVNIADFSDTDFCGLQWDFGGEICFEDFKFGPGASFKNAKFPRHTSFDRAVIGRSSDFSNVTIDARSSFKSTKFSWYTKLKSIYLEDWIDFDYAEFEGGNDFSESSFGHCTRFNGAKFGPDISFVDCTFRQAVCFESIQSNTQEAVAWTPYDPTSKTFNRISFERCKFEDSVSFKNREFRDTAIFDNATFKKTPIFFGCTLHQDMSFKHVTFPPATGEGSRIRTYRNLRLSFSQLQAPQEEQLFFQLEMAEAARTLTGTKRWLFFIYEKLSNYGSSISKPLLAYLISFGLFSCAYAALSWATHCLPDNQECSFNMAGIEFSLLQAIPLPGLEKMAEPIRSEIIANSGVISLVATALIILQKSVSLLLVFLVGLAIRNTFRIK
ncbi:pentapeptide repeat-containing protein [Pseudomonas sp. GOM7]|uniref:pentapeptide repeat-containing protein n=1 Tax=Pseudomonas sp. GOM7 TaxID=2998079 RepID=UPI00227B0A1E|nr:pentapeptide repeat-containing protein [Pseudomonas sp. GOM7]WAJ35484.1 pentapeptide repeat-containing protein [Pseudomonas sp. GOM7]